MNLSSTPRILRYALAAVCAMLIAYAGLRCVTLVTDSRTAALLEAEQAITLATAGRIQQDRIPDSLIESVAALIDARAPALNYVTLRNANRATLVSRGRFTDRFDWLGADMGRQLRGWSYQLESAEADRPLMQAGQRVGYARFGVNWFSVLGRAGLSLVVWLTALLAGVVGFLGALSSASARREIGGAQPAPERPADVPAQSRRGEGAGKPASRLLRRRKNTSKDDFAPITSRQVPASAREQSPAGPSSRPGASARPTPEPEPASAAIPARAKTAEPALPDKPSTPESVSAETSVVARDTPPPRHESSTAPDLEPGLEVVPTPTPTPTPAPDPIQPAPAQAQLHAPRLDIQPSLGDDTLDLRFYPIWRDAQCDVLAGACAALVWREGQSPLVDVATLAELAERGGALRAFTQWIARRFSLLHSNWRTLEIDTVPIMLPISGAMLGFADAEAVWRDALRRSDRDPNDLILRWAHAVGRDVDNTLPVRRALSLDAHDKPTPADCDVACIDATRIGPDIDQWHARIEKLRCPVLLGPIEAPAEHARLINHARVLWFSDADTAVHTPRAFARLLARHTTQPM